MRCILIGYGYWGKIIKKYIDDSDNFELVGIFDHQPDDLLRLDSVVKSGNIEAAFVCVPVDAHFDVTKMLLEHHIHVFCEKPLCRTSKQVDLLYQIAVRNQVVLFADYIYTVSPSIQDMKNYLYEFGNILYIAMNIRQFGRFYPEDHVFDVIGVHMISALAFLFETATEDIKVTSVDVIEKGSNGLPDAGTLFFNLRDEIKGKIECSLLSIEKERKIEILCEKGIIAFDMLGSQTIRIVSYSKNAGTKTVYECKHDEANNLVFMLDYFYHTIKTRDQLNEQVTKQVADVLEQVNTYIFKNREENDQLI